MRGKFESVISGLAELPPIKNLVEDFLSNSPFFLGRSHVRKLNHSAYTCMHALMFSGSILSFHFTFYSSFFLFRALEEQFVYSEWT